MLRVAHNHPFENTMQQINKRDYIFADEQDTCVWVFPENTQWPSRRSLSELRVLVQLFAFGYFVLCCWLVSPRYICCFSCVLESWLAGTRSSWVMAKLLWLSWATDRCDRHVFLSCANNLSRQACHALESHFSVEASRCSMLVYIIYCFEYWLDKFSHFPVSYCWVLDAFDQSRTFLSSQQNRHRQDRLGSDISATEALWFLMDFGYHLGMPGKALADLNWPGCPNHFSLTAFFMTQSARLWCLCISFLQTIRKPPLNHPCASSLETINKSVQWQKHH